MPSRQRFPYTILRNGLGEEVSRPILSVELIYQGQSIKATGLADTGADVNVLPYDLGNALGLVWEAEHYAMRLSGNLGHI